MTRPWATLGKLAEKDLDALRLEITRIDEAVRSSKEREVKLLALVQENRDRLSRPLEDGRLMGDIQVIGMFIQNLSKAINGLKSEQKLLLDRREVAELKFRETRLRIKKMESLIERDEEKISKKQNIEEQRALDAAGLARFNRAVCK
jgi:flagellar export protein FliJ